MRSEVELLLALGRLEKHVQAQPLRWARWTQPQVDYLSSTANRKLFRLGNRGGKSFAALADVQMRAEKAHPWRPDWNRRHGPQHQWIVTVSWSQAIPLMRIFRQFLGEGVRQPTWDEARGWGKDAPTLVYPDGSTVGWRTMRQGPLAHAGAELDHILIDEPCRIDHYRELDRRLVSRAGDLSIALTPVNAPGDLYWLQELVMEGLIAEVHYPMTEALFRYVDDGSLRRLPDGTTCDQAWIEEQGKTVPKRWREIVLHGGWDEVVVDSEFDGAWDRGLHVIEELPTWSTGQPKLSLGIDHGTKAFTETAVLVAVDESTEYPSITVLGCWEAPENSPAEEDARGIVGLLEDNGLKWGDLHHATGDIPHFGGRGRLRRKSNADLAYELAKELRLRRNQSLSPPIRTAKSGMGSSPRYSVIRGVSWLHRALLRKGQFAIHSDAERLAECFERYRGGSTDPYGHLMDALRYALDPWIRRGQQRTGRTRAQIRIA